MKKIIFSLAIIMAAVSCSHNDVSNNSSTSADAISFSALKDRVMSKSATDNDDIYQVYATQEGVTTGWYINDNTTDGTSDLLTQTYYWPADGSTLTFFAYAPSGSDYIDDTSTASTEVAFTYTVGTAATEDFTIATPVVSQSSGDVSLVFSHMLSKVSIDVSLTDDLTSAGYTLSWDGDAVLSVATNSSSYTYTVGDAAIPTAVDATSDTDIAYTGSGSTSTSAASFMIMPQSAVSCTIDLTGVSITDPSGKEINTTDDKVLSTYTITSDDLTLFVAGVHYSITLVVEEETDDLLGSQITFTSSQTDWVDEDELELYQSVLDVDDDTLD